MKTILTIAGSDSSAGAGIQADLKTISALGAYAATAITAVTAQNTLGVQAVYPIPADMLERQLNCVMDDLQPDAIKIGMLPSDDAVRTVARCLKGRDRSTIPVVLDPVMVSTSGHRLMPESTARLACSELFPLCTLITPNLSEAALILATACPSAEVSITSPTDMQHAATALSAYFTTSFLVKGGHLDSEELCDILCHKGCLTLYPSPRIASPNLHGTGCTLSSAIATHIAKGLPMPEAVARSIAYLHQAISEACDLHIGHGNGPLQHFIHSTSKI